MAGQPQTRAVCAAVVDKQVAAPHSHRCVLCVCALHAFRSPTLCSYPEELGSQFHAVDGPYDGTPLHAIYAPGHYIASFSGCNVILANRTHCNQMFEEFAAQAG